MTQGSRHPVCTGLPVGTQETKAHSPPLPCCLMGSGVVPCVGAENGINPVSLSAPASRWSGPDHLIKNTEEPTPRWALPSTAQTNFQ